VLGHVRQEHVVVHLRLRPFWAAVIVGIDRSCRPGSGLRSSKVRTPVGELPPNSDVGQP